MNLALEQSIVADHLFFSEVGEGSVERTVLIMLWHVKEANQLIQAKVGYTRPWRNPLPLSAEIICGWFPNGCSI